MTGHGAVIVYMTHSASFLNSLAPVDVLFRLKLYIKNAPAILFLYQSPNNHFMCSEYDVKLEIYAAFLL